MIAAAPAQTGRIQALHPLTKLAAAVLLVAATYLLPGLLAPLLIFFVVVALAAAAGVLGSFLGTTLKALIPITFSLFLIQGVLFPPPDATPLLTLGPITLTREGLVFAFLTSTRLLAFTSTILLVLRTTHPADLVAALTSLGLPRSVGYILLVTLQIIPDMVARATAIIEAQRSRGLETEGGLRRLRALAPLVGPLIVGALLDVEERAMAIESRAFLTPGPKTTLRVLADTPLQRVARWIMLLAVLGLVGWRLALALT